MRARIALLFLLVIATGCTAHAGSSTGTISGATVMAGAAAPVTTTVTVNSTTTARPVSSNIEQWLRAVQTYVNGSRWTDNGLIPRANDDVNIPGAEGFVNGTLSYTQAAGRTTISRSTQVAATGLGAGASLELTIRSSASDPRSTVDVLHRGGNPDRDYLLTGDAFRAAAPTPWVTVPARYGNGMNCVLPGRSTVCQVVVALLANQRLTPSMPKNSITVKGGTTTIF